MLTDPNYFEQTARSNWSVESEGRLYDFSDTEVIIIFAFTNSSVEYIFENKFIRIKNNQISRVEPIDNYDQFVRKTIELSSEDGFLEIAQILAYNTKFYSMQELLALLL